MPGYASPLFNLLGAKYIASKQGLTEIDPHAVETKFPLVHDSGIKVWQNPDVLPRIMALTEIYVEPEMDRAIAEGSLAPVDYRTTAVLPHTPSTLSGIEVKSRARISLPGSGQARATLLEYRNTQVTIGVESSRDAIVELHDPYYFAWNVYVDGNRREMLQSNYMFRGRPRQTGRKTGSLSVRAIFGVCSPADDLTNILSHRRFA
jgi:hypothetical protein